ncbi:MAG: histidine triad nucleotide-binding protein [Gammaproteobacteria bacterium RIFCSPHIGHO2_02_FULL_39_13]|nr:MAG: histidine triad nucleotide-binding protein [Gammaproteobacteria bacterium RIFCSPHIGHO2_02_FULL_39_13]OGT50436.1 MAG: histidine triad nucleotide-binding protein [Gammaproteobacteria bacterium RIFCSPHIGHO2_12_FULL_39_24]
MDCLFCKIATSQIPAQLIYQDEHIVAFNDITPQAPHHVLIIPRKHIETINDILDSDNNLIGNMMLVAKKIAHDVKIADNGYRVLMNCNKDGGQAVYHIHFHLLGGRQMQWPPG